MWSVGHDTNYFYKTKEEEQVQQNAKTEAEKKK